jgi:large subunit ribosomal protein L31e
MVDEKKKEEPEAEEALDEAAEAGKEEESVVESLEKELKEEEKAEEAAEGEAKEEGPEEAEEEEAKKPSRKEKEEKEEDIVEEKTFTVPLSKAWIMPANKRAPKAMRILKNFIIKHMKLKTAPKKAEEGEEEELGSLVITNEVNERIWTRGIEKPPRNIRIRAAKDKDGDVTVYLAEGD